MPTSTQRFRLVGEDDASRAFLQVAAASRLLKSNMDDVSSSVLGLGKLMGGTSLIPIVAGATAAVTELTTSLGAASGAAGIFGLSAFGTLKGMVTAQKGIQTTEKSLSGLTKGTTAYADAAKKLHMQQAAFQQDYGKAAKGYGDMTDAWGKFLHATGPVTQGTLGKGFDLIASVLPKLVPVSNAAGKAIGGLIDDLQGWTEGPSFKHLLHFLETSGPKDIKAFGHIIGNTLGGLGGILSNFVGPGDHAAKTLEHLTANFDKWGHSKGVSESVNKFLKYIGDNGPEITSALSSMAQATPKIATSLGKLGSANLSVTSRFLNLIAGLPQGAFNVVVDGLFAMAAGSRAITAVTGIGAILTGLKGVAGGKGLAGTGGGILGGAGVQKVYVVNMGEGGLGGTGTGPRGLGKVASNLIGFTAITAAVAAGAKIGFAKGASETAQWQKMGANSLMGYEQARLAQMIKQNGGPRGTDVNVGPIGLHLDASRSIKSTSTAVEALNARLGKASAGMELVGHSANRAFPGATKQVTTLSGKMAAINGGKASAAMDLVGHSASKNFAAASGQADQFKGKLNGIPSNKTVKVNADTGQAQAAVSSIKAAIAGIQRIVNVHVNVTRSTNATLAEASGNPPDGSGHPHGASTGMGGPNWLHTLAPMVGSGKISLANLLANVRGARQTGRSRLQATISTRNQFAAGFQGFASSAFGADFGTDADTGAAVAPTISSILAYQKTQRRQARMVKHDVRDLVKRGLSPALLKQLQAAGAAGIPTLEALAGGTRAQIETYNRLNKQTSSALHDAGMTAGNRIYGQRIKQEAHHEKQVEHLLKQLIELAKHHPDRLIAELKGDHIDLVLATKRRKNGGKLQSDPPKKPH